MQSSVRMKISKWKRRNGGTMSITSLEEKGKIALLLNHAGEINAYTSKT